MANTMQQIASNPLQFYRLSYLKQRLGVSGSTIWNWCRNGTFPKPIKLSENCTAWNAADVEAWAQDRISVSQKAE